jgi:hypothetical protein
MSQSLIDRVMHLVRLAGSDNEHEARNAAVQACRMIRDAKLVLVSQAMSPSGGARSTTSPDPGCDECAGEGFYYFSGQRRPCSCMLRQGTQPHASQPPASQPPVAHARVQSQGQKTADAAREILRKAGLRQGAPMGSPSPTASTPLKRPRPVVMVDAVSTPMRVPAAKLGGRCQDCQKPYAQGEDIWYRRGVGCVHGRCDPAALV